MLYTTNWRFVIHGHKKSEICDLRGHSRWACRFANPSLQICFCMDTQLYVLMVWPLSILLCTKDPLFVPLLSYDLQQSHALLYISSWEYSASAINRPFILTNGTKAPKLPSNEGVFKSLLLELQRIGTYFQERQPIFGSQTILKSSHFVYHLHFLLQDFLLLLWRGIINYSNN